MFSFVTFRYNLFFFHSIGQMTAVRSSVYLGEFVQLVSSNHEKRNDDSEAMKNKTAQKETISISRNRTVVHFNTQHNTTAKQY